MAVVLALASCGGGGGGGGGVGAAAPFVAGPATRLGALNPYDLALGYFDNDARHDLALPGLLDFSESRGWTVGSACYLGTDDGGFEGAAPATVGVPDPAAGARVLQGHFDAGATQDLAVVSGRAFSVLRGRGDGTFDPAADALRILPFGLVSSDVEVLDANHDFYDDLVVGTTTGDLAMLLGDASGGFLVFDVLPVAPGQRILDLTVFDMDGDGYDDVVALDDSARVTVMLGDTAGSLVLGSSILTGLPGDSRGIALGLFDYVPGTDLAVLRGPFATPTPHLSVMIVSGDGAGGFGIIAGAVDLPEGAFSLPPRCERVWRGGELSDLVVACGDTPYLARSLYLIELDILGTGIPRAERLALARPVELFRAADVDDDWLTDLVTVSEPEYAPGTSSISVYAQVYFGLRR